MSDLLGCPFCGSPATLKKGGGNQTTIACSNKRGCWAEIRFFDNIKHAMRLWNTRAPQPSDRAAVIEALRRLAQSHADYWKRITDPTPEHAEMAASQMQHIADALAAIPAQAFPSPDGWRDTPKNVGG
jgi:hypothetical protein